MEKKYSPFIFKGKILDINKTYRVIQFKNNDNGVEKTRNMNTMFFSKSFKDEKTKKYVVEDSVQLLWNTEGDDIFVFGNKVKIAEIISYDKVSYLDKQKNERTCIQIVIKVERYEYNYGEENKNKYYQNKSENSENRYSNNSYQRYNRYYDQNDFGL